MKIKEIISKVKVSATKKNIIKISIVTVVLIMSMLPWVMNVIAPIIILAYVGYLLVFNPNNK